MWASFVRKRGLGFHLGVLVFSSPSEVCEANDQRVCLYVQAKQAVVTPNRVKTSVGRQLRCGWSARQEFKNQLILEED